MNPLESKIVFVVSTLTLIRFCIEMLSLSACEVVSMDHFGHSLVFLEISDQFRCVCSCFYSSRKHHSPTENRQKKEQIAWNSMNITWFKPERPNHTNEPIVWFIWPFATFISSDLIVSESIPMENCRISENWTTNHKQIIEKTNNFRIERKCNAIWMSK